MYVEWAQSLYERRYIDPPGASAGSAGVREPRRPRSPHNAAGAAAVPDLPIDPPPGVTFIVANPRAA